MKSLLSYASSFRQRALALFNHTDAVKDAAAAERRDRWNETIAGHRRPLEAEKKSES